LGNLSIIRSTYALNSSGKDLASFRSAVSKPSVNQFVDFGRQQSSLKGSALAI
jgi:hypothetical protein